MSQFLLYKNQDKNSAKAYPYFVNVQSDLLNNLDSRIVLPLTPIELLEAKAPTRLCPVIQINQGDFVILTQQITSVPMQILQEEIADLSAFRDEIINALDFLITGI
ncbi:CcdB family protein [Catenovulum agarivorans]|uniref:CcdB family protein n=1 Tax=Catenovulum agarivorans TaxID=1172192 RepID=UPI00037F6826|nr:CcdB family protein [Catenovulum agarivorans]